MGSEEEVSSAGLRPFARRLPSLLTWSLKTPKVYGIRLQKYPHKYVPIRLETSQLLVYETLGALHHIHYYIQYY